MIVLQTERLYLREMTSQDAEMAYLLNSDPEVLKYTGDKAFESVEDARVFLENYAHFKMYGFGRWAVIQKSNNEFLGWCGLKYTKELNEHDIGYRLFKKHWNKGFATEAAKSCVDFGFIKFKMPFIVGRAMYDNKASIKVLEKIGLSFYKIDTCGGQEGVVYKIENPKTNQKL